LARRPRSCSITIFEITGLSDVLPFIDAPPPAGDGALID
jgi:hypothetical protein